MQVKNKQIVYFFIVHCLLNIFLCNKEAQKKPPCERLNVRFFYGQEKNPAKAGFLNGLGWGIFPK